MPLNLATWYADHYLLCITTCGTVAIAIITGTLGVFAFLRKQSLVGDAIAHAALPGIALTLLLTPTPPGSAPLAAGGTVAGCIGVFLLTFIAKKTTLKTDTILGIILSVFFGLGLVLMTMLQRRGMPLIAKFLFGNSTTLLATDLPWITGGALIVLGSMLLLWKEFKLVVFDPHLATTLGYNTLLLDSLLTFLLVITIVLGLHSIGVILMGSMLIAPAVAARQWTNQLSTMVFLSAGMSSCASVAGLFISIGNKHLPTGPVIVIIMSLLVGFSLVWNKTLSPSVRS